MKIKTMKSVFMTIFLLSTAKCAMSQITERSFINHKIPGSVNKDTIHTNQLKAFFEIDTSQHQSNDGLKFSIKLINTSSDIDTVFNVLSEIHIELLNDSNKNVFFRENKSTPSVYKQGSSFIVENVKINGISANIIIDDKHTRYCIIPAKSSYEIFIKVPKIINSQATLPHNATQLTEISKGIYHLFIRMAVVHFSIKYNYARGDEPVAQTLYLGPLSIFYGIK